MKAIILLAFCGSLTQVTVASANAGGEGIEYLARLGPSGKLDRATGVITLNLKELNEKLVPELSRRGLTPTEMYLQINGGSRNGGQDLQVALDLNEVAYQGLPGHRQQSARVVYRRNHRDIHFSEVMMFETANFPKFKVDHPDAELRLPASLTRKTGMDASFVKLSSQIQHQNTVWTVTSNSTNNDLKEEFFKYGSALQPTPVKNDQGEVQYWIIVNSLTGRRLAAAPHDILLAADAAFSEHHFYWDSHIVVEALAATDPQIAISTLLAWLGAQREDGGIPRETDLKWTPYQPEQDIKFGRVRPNPEWFNPPIAGWAAHQLAAWAPQEMPTLLPKMIQSSERQRQWLRRNFGVFTAGHKLKGFTWSNLGSGRDNAPRPLDRGALAVDLLAQYKMMLDHEREFHLILGQFNQAESKHLQAQAVGRTINELYFNPERQWFFDLEPDGQGGYYQNTEMTLAGFWPVMAKVCSASQLNAIIKENITNPKRFGGGPFLPSVAKDSRFYDEAGHYWRGGGWPPDWNLVMGALYENHRRVLASDLMQEHLSAMATASNLFAMGVTPDNVKNYLEPVYQERGYHPYHAFAKRVRERLRLFFADFQMGKLKNLKAPGRATVFESLGLFRDQNGRPVVTFNQELGEPLTLHNTRVDFGGWGAAVALNAPRHIAGLDAVPAFHGKPKDLKRWLYHLLTEPEFRYHQVHNLPAFRRVAKYLKTHPKAGFSEFTRQLEAEKSPETMRELTLLSRGYVEISPTFDIETRQTEFKQFTFAGHRFNLSIDATKNDNVVRVTAISPAPIRVQFNRNWIRTAEGSLAVDDAQASSNIYELGGGHPSAEFQLVPRGDALQTTTAHLNESQL